MFQKKNLDCTMYIMVSELVAAQIIVETYEVMSTCKHSAKY